MPRLANIEAGACPYRIELGVERRPANALNIEIGAPQPRCTLKLPDHWMGSGRSAIRWLGSGGSPLVFGNCSANCPKEQAVGPMSGTFAAVRACAEAILNGHVLQAEHVSAGRGIVVDWRTVKSGETIQEGGDAFDTAQLFVALVGPEAAFAVAADLATPVQPFKAPPPHVVTYGQSPRGGRARSFTVGEFKVLVEPCADDDEGQAAFASQLAAMAATVAE